MTLASVIANVDSKGSASSHINSEAALATEQYRQKRTGARHPAQIAYEKKMADLDIKINTLKAKLV